MIEQINSADVQTVDQLRDQILKGKLIADSNRDSLVIQKLQPTEKLKTMAKAEVSQ